MYNKGKKEESPMQYDFETLVDRREIGSSKYYFAQQASPQMPDNIVPLSVADMELKNPPEIMAGLREFLDDDKVILGYTIPTMGYLRALMGWMERIHGWKIDPQWLVLSPGVIPALYESVKCYTDPGDGVILFSPVYYPFRDAITLGGRAVVDIPLLDDGTRYTIDWNRLEDEAKKPENKLLLLCSPHNPVGRVWTREELTQLAEICNRNHVLVISDEIHEDILMPGYRHTVYSTISEESAQNCVICTAPSKTFNLAGMQTANILIPNSELREKFRKEMSDSYMRTLTITGFKACELAYTQCDEWYRQMLRHIDSNRLFVENYMVEQIPQIQVRSMEGTYLQWWDCRSLGMEPKELEQFQRQKAYLILDEGYIFGQTGAGFERINLACPQAVLEQALERLRGALAKR